MLRTIPSIDTCISADSFFAYNTFIRKFPQNIIANMSGFRQKEKFAADAAAQTAPKVSF